MSSSGRQSALLRARASGRWFTGDVPGSTTTVLLANRVYFCPVDVEASHGVQALAVFITAGGTAGSVIRLGLYGDTGAGLPGALLVDGGTVVGTAIAQPSLVVALTLAPGRYYTAVCGQGAPATQPTVQSSSGGGGSEWVGMPTAADRNANGFTLDGVAGALPNPAGAVVDNSSVALGYLRVA